MNSVEKYEKLIEKFIKSQVSAEFFQATYLEFFKSEYQLNEHLYEILDELFGDVDCFTTNLQLLADEPNFYLDEDELRRKARLALNRLLFLKRQA